MKKCNNPNCQFKYFLDKNIYYYKELNGDTKCIFHISKEYKEKRFREIDKQLFNSILEKYLWYCKNNNREINLSNIVFISTQVFKNNNFSNLSLNFDKAEFIDNIDFENIKCKELNLNNCKIYDGGRLKNRGSKDSLHIEKLIFKPYLLKSDFIIDLGNYVDENGLVETSNIGTIQYIKFSNQQLENGKVFFVGLNNNLKEADFTNKFLDNVIFHNSDLSKCRFLNSKILNTTFLNVHFDRSDNYFEYMISPKNIIKSLKYFLFIFSILPILIFYITNINLITLIFLSIFLISLSINTIFEFVLKIINKLFLDKSINTGKHLITYDEYKLIKQIKNEKLAQNIHESYKNLQNLYEELTINFQKTDKYLSSEFIYSMKHTNSLLIEKYSLPTIDYIIYSLHNLINGFGQRWGRALLWFLLTIGIFTWIFTNKIQPNIDYISTYNTPSFLIGENCEINETTYSDKNFTLYIKTTNLSNNIIYGYNNNNNFNFNKQKILCLKEKNITIGLYKSLSNLLYPFAPESKKWFQNTSQQSIVWSFIETLLLWIFLLAFFRALWNKIKVDS